MIMGVSQWADPVTLVSTQGIAKTVSVTWPAGELQELYGNKIIYNLYFPLGFSCFGLFCWVACLWIPTVWKVHTALNVEG